MGAWGIKNFENDTAIDWLNEFQQEADFTIPSGIKPDMICHL